MRLSTVMLQCLGKVRKKQLSTVQREAPGKNPVDCGDVRLIVEL